MTIFASELARLIGRVLAEARRRRRAHVHLMLPDGYALEPFQQAGFRYHERERDVWLYAARTADLRL